MLAGEAPAPHSSSHTVASKDARLAPYCNHVPRLRAGTRPGPSLAQKRRSFRMTTLKGFYIGPAEAEPFRSYGTSGTLASTLPDWADEGIRPYVSSRIRRAGVRFGVAEAMPFPKCC